MDCVPSQNQILCIRNKMIISNEKFNGKQDMLKNVPKKKKIMKSAHSVGYRKIVETRA